MPIRKDIERLARFKEEVPGFRPSEVLIDAQERSIRKVLGLRSKDPLIYRGLPLKAMRPNTPRKSRRKSK